MSNAILHFADRRYTLPNHPEDAIIKILKVVRRVIGRTPEGLGVVGLGALTVEKDGKDVTREFINDVRSLSCAKERMMDLFYKGIG